jgi:hypothetical protein
MSQILFTISLDPSIPGTIFEYQIQSMVPMKLYILNAKSEGSWDNAVSPRSE